MRVQHGLSLLIIAPMDRLPLPTLLSHALVAFIIEFDNEFEHQTPHRTTNHGATPGSVNPPYLLSMVMWVMLLRFVGEDGVPVRELQSQAHLPDKEFRMWLIRMSKWWGYVIVERNPDPQKWMVRPTPGGRKALESWRPLTGVIEKRWQKRFASGLVEELRESLSALIQQFDAELPDCLPILGYGLLSQVPDTNRPAAEASNRALPTLLSKALLAFALDFERESELSLAICANALRLIDEGGVRVRDLPRLAGVSKEAIATSLSFLEKRGYAAVEPQTAGSRVKVLKLMPKGRHARDTYHQLVWTIEERWQELFGHDTVRRARESLERLIGEPGSLSPLFQGLEPYPDGWRAAVAKPETLPHYPMVLHRGGFPDGS
jgi:DNA-binding MarR family transcriptional regulator